jgi:hypothetical protein
MIFGIAVLLTLSLIMRAHVRALPQSCLLVLHPGETGRCSLASALHRILRGSRRSVWVDCRQLTALPAEALLLLRQGASRLW